MQLGDKIKELRKEKEYSQEELAEKMNVSRSAVAKWESNHGLPEITNLKKLSVIFEKSVDELIDYTKGLEDETLEVHPINSTSHYIGGFYDIECVGWNEGAYDAYLLNEDENFIFYLLKEKNKKIHGLIGKKYIQNITPSSKKFEIDEQDIFNIRLEDFYGKPVLIEIANKRGLLGFFDFRNDDYQSTWIESSDEKKIVLQFGRELMLHEISKIEELFD